MASSTQNNEDITTFTPIEPAKYGYRYTNFCGIRVIMNKHGLINLTKMCLSVKIKAKRYCKWLECKGSSKLIEKYEALYHPNGVVNPEKFMYRVKKLKNTAPPLCGGTYAIEEIAFIVAIWAGLALAMDTPEYKRLISVLKDEIQEKTQKLELETKEKLKFKIAYMKKSKKVVYPTFDTHECLYIWHDPMHTKPVYKVGKAKNINDRMKSYRTPVPRAEIDFIVYFTDSDLSAKQVTKLENAINDRFELNLEYNNHETYTLELSAIIKYIIGYFALNEHIAHKIESDVEKYNVIIRGLSDPAYDNIEISD